PSARSRIEDYKRGVGQAGRSIRVSLDDEVDFSDADFAEEADFVDGAFEPEAEAAAAEAETEAVALDGTDALTEAVALLAEAAAALGPDDADEQASADVLAARLDALADSIERLAADVAAVAARLEAGVAGGAAAPTENLAQASDDPGAAEPTDAAADDEDGGFFNRGQQIADWGGLTALIFAAREGDIESAKLLIEAGADVNQTSEFGWTPLLTATQNRFYRLGKCLLEQGADPNLANKSGWTPLYLATDNRNIEGGDYPTRKPDMDHLEYTELLLAHGADPNLRLATDCGRPGCASTETRTIFTHQWLYEEGATPFLRAAQSGDLELVGLLLAHEIGTAARK